MVKSEPKKKPQPGGFFQRFFRKSEKSQKEQRLTVQRSIPYLEMGRDGICRVEEHLYSKTVRFYDINYQLAQNEDKNTIFESWCDFLNYFDASIRFQLSFINHKSDMSEYNRVIQIEPQHDQFDDVRMEYAQMLKQQLSNGEVEDNMMDDPSKEFFTVKTKGGNTFFLVIDRARNSENVYMLSMIDEYDLQEFLDDEERNGQQEEETPAVVLPETKPEPTPDVEIEEPKEESSGGMNKILLLVFVAALGGAGAFFYFYIYKPKPKEETPQSENLETDQSLATVNEDSQQE